MPNVSATMTRFVRVAAASIFMGIIITGIMKWSSGVYPFFLEIAFILAAFAGLLTVIPGVPQIVARNLASTLFSASMFWAGIILMVP
jgi:hypothetical protein